MIRQSHNGKEVGMIYTVLIVTDVVLILASVIALAQFRRSKPNVKVVAVSLVVILMTFSVSVMSQVQLDKILRNSAVIERNGEYVRVSPYYSEEFLKEKCGTEYYISPNGVDSMFAQLISKVIKTSPYNE